jgi:enterochelin esterase-like enzyme
LGRRLGQALRHRQRPDRRLVTTGAAVVALAGAVVTVVVGAVPLVRYGPSYDLYLPAAGRAVPAGHVMLRTFHSQAIGEDRPFAVYLPPGDGRPPLRRYPVVYLLHGDPGSYQDWLNLGIAHLLDAGIASGRLSPVIAVMPDGNGGVMHASQWANSWDGRQRVEDSVLELVALVDRDYPTLTNRQDRVVAGLSEGGYGAANLAARHPDLFGVAISLSGYFSARGPVFGSNPAYLRSNSPSQLLLAPGPARAVDYLLAVGEEDPHYRREAQVFAAELDRLGVRHQLFLLSGGHGGEVWTTGLVTSLEQVNTQLGAARSR